ncbi:hypothetical protein SPIRO4BDMA_30037 [uncultured spirochete]|jgi:hypothetical protein|uniref:Uncharacterized protein n=1 Tax=uncultured spirochete TaxID=156406 RepID=A0A3P3XM82_9SPIR|nr:hypothetical protein SPIRO4BDMA_30037 [uncultured spirochete]
MILYHMNIGFPFLSEKSKICIDSKEVVSRNKKFEDEAEKWQELLAPTEGYEERVFYHRVRPDSAGKACIELRNDENPHCGYGLRIRYSTEVLDHFVECLAFCAFSMAQEVCTSDWLLLIFL